MIHSIYIHNFKAFAKAEIPLERLTVIVGPNASGKTSILQALDRLSLIMSTPSPLQVFNNVAPEYFRRQDAGVAGMHIGYSDDDGGSRFRVSFQTPPGPETRTAIKSVEFDGWDRTADQPGEWKSISPSSGGIRPLRAAAMLRLDASRLAAASPVWMTRMMQDGSGLASNLAMMALDEPEAFALIQERMRKIIPTLIRVRIDRKLANVEPGGIQYKELDGKDPVPGFAKDIREVLKLDFLGAPDIPAAHLSEGTLLVLGLLTALAGGGQPRLILLDDLDRGLHPRAQREVVGLLRAVQTQDPELQIVATTHSPYLIDCLRPEEVRLTTLDDDGTARCGSLIEHPDFAKWKDEMLPGEMWSLFGEKWVADLNKAGEGR